MAIESRDARWCVGIFPKMSLALHERLQHLAMDLTYIATSTRTLTLSRGTPMACTPGPRVDIPRLGSTICSLFPIDRDQVFESQANDQDQAWSAVSQDEMKGARPDESRL